MYCKHLLALISIASIFVFPGYALGVQAEQIENLGVRYPNLYLASEKIASLTYPKEITSEKTLLEEIRLLADRKAREEYGSINNLKLTQLAEKLELANRILIREFKFKGNTVLSDKQLLEVLQNVVGQQIESTEVFALADRITNYYNEQGYTTSFAAIFPQKLEEGVVTIDITEGRLEDIDVEVEGWLRPKYVRERFIKILGTLEETVYNQKKLNEAVQLLLQDENVEKLVLEQDFEEISRNTSLKVKVIPTKRFGITLRTDNGRSPSVGSVNRIAVIKARPSPLGDRLIVGYLNTDGSDGIDLFYGVPVNARNGEFFLAYSQNNSQVIEIPFRVNDIDFDSDLYLIGYRQPLIETPNTELAVGVLGSRISSDSTIENRAFQLVRGSDETGNLTVSTISFFQEYSNRWRNNFFSARSSMNFGVDAFDATNTGEIDGQFFSWRGLSQYVNFLAPDTLSIAKLALQLTPNDLPSPEQISLGGRETVRGYRQSQVVGDNGVFASVEMWLPMWRDEDLDMALQMAPFFDFGHGWNNDRTLEKDNTLFSVGVGLQYRIKDRFRDRFIIRLDYGIPIVRIESNVVEPTLQDDGFYFLVEFNY
ncbi:MAG: ShlB/FhaC/HecB family hemolysin secretion/activation protein [Prochloraceae cyanobacterium]|nr:ShlB/FhaC/HecB family hemolysin secretion/activation protein [Prochloraceae cyanobacterium]